MTRGQPVALAAVRSMVLGPAPHAVLLVGPASSGKTTLALDLAAGLLCVAPDPADRPCRACRGCRQVASGNHPDLHWLAPEGPGGQVKIGRATDPEPGTVRHLTAELALLPVEGGARVAIVEQAHRLNEDAQNALLKMLEEPPPRVTIVLCADDDERLLPTVRSRCVRVRLGPVAPREIERWLGELEAADAPLAARLARLSVGRPGLALAYARSPEAPRLRGEIGRGLLDLLGADRYRRLALVRELTATAAALNAALAQGRRAAEPAPDEQPSTRKRGRRAASSPATDDAADAGPAKPPAERTAADRRAAAATLLEVWASLARDLAVAGSGGRRQLDDPELLEELESAAANVGRAEIVAFVARLNEVAWMLDENVNPELALDVLALAWPRPAGAAGRKPATAGAGR